MIAKEKLLKIARLCDKPIESVGQFDLNLLGIEPSNVAPSVVDYFFSSVPEAPVFARPCSSRDFCRLYPIHDIVEMNKNAVPSCYIVNHGFVAFGSDLSGDAFTVDVDDGHVYIVSHEEDWEELILDKAEELGGGKRVVVEYSEHVADSIEQFLDTLLYQLREIDQKEREFFEFAMSNPSAVNDDGNTLLIVAIQENDLQTFRKIIELGANVDAVSNQDRP
ncbi:MAG: ankyrin repeat domain-containing protein, partial [Pirellula sp.]|nr:ankyrin repeat domain-containing protein [Pirellula sp.]